MEQRLENSTLTALRELRSYEKERLLTERHKQEEEARQARAFEEQARLAEEAARERALEKQLRTDLRRAEEEIRRLRREAERRMAEATRDLQVMQAVADVPKPPLPLQPVPASKVRRSAWLAASGYTALLASACILGVGLHGNPSRRAEDSHRNSACTTTVAPTASPATVATASAPEIAPPQSPASELVERSRQRTPTPRPSGGGQRQPIRIPSSPKPTCDGTDPLCGLSVNSMKP